MREEREERCLEIIKNELFYRDGILIKNFLNNKTFLEVDDADFCNNYLFYSNHEFSKNYFGLTEEQRKEFANIVRKVKPNPSSSLFPDFVFNDGFIEHFCVTSSSVTRKGATHTKKENEFFSTVNKETEQLKSEWNESPSFDEVRSKYWEFNNPVHAYEFLEKSFKNNWEHHLESYKKYNGSKQIGIFMVEYPEFALAMCESVYNNWIDGMSSGDMREQESFKEYRLSRDKKLLEYIYQFKNEIKYVIFINQKRCEIIYTENIPYLIKLLPWDFIIYPLVVTTVSSMHNISIPLCTNQENK